MTSKRDLLHHFFIDALRSYTEDFYMIEKGNPMRVHFNGEKYVLHISPVQKAGRGHKGERRIQLSKENIDDINSYLKLGGYKVAFVGYYKDGKTFVAWDYNHVLKRPIETQRSFYARTKKIMFEKNNHIGFYKFSSRVLERYSFAIALPITKIGFYLQNIDKFHSLHGDELKNYQESVDFPCEPIETGSGTKIEIGNNEKRKYFEYISRVYPRDSKFRDRIMTAYDGSCCICGRQLDMVQAAHIIPHAHPEGDDSVNNGLALCVEHHYLYDSALLLLGPGRKLFFNEERAEFLEQIGQGEGVDEVRSKHDKEYSVPEGSEDQPSDENLEKGLEIRMGK